LSITNYGDHQFPPSATGIITTQCPPRGPKLRALRYSSPNGALPCSQIMAITNYGNYQFPHPPFLSQKTCMEPTFMNEQSKRNHRNQRSPTTKQLAILPSSGCILDSANYPLYQVP